MSLPVSQYEALLAEVRGLRRKAQHVQQLANPLISNLSTTSNASNYPHSNTNQQNGQINCGFLHNHTMDPIITARQYNTASPNNCDGAGVSSGNEGGDTTCSEDEYIGINNTTRLSVSSEPVPQQRNRDGSLIYHGQWHDEHNLWSSEPSNSSAPVYRTTTSHINQQQQHDLNSVMSFNSSSDGLPLERILDTPNHSRRSSQQLEAKVDVVYSLLAMLSGQEHADMGETLLALSTNPESCLAMRQSGCIPLLVQLVQSDKDSDTRLKASQALYNLVNSQQDEKLKKRELRIFKLLENIRAYTEAIKTNKEFISKYDLNSTSSTASSSTGGGDNDNDDKHPVQTIAHLMKLSFDEGHRQAICQLGGIYIIASLVEVEHVIHGSTTDEINCILLRRYACMALTNLTFGDSGNKALLCSYREFMRALVIQLKNKSDELRQVTASVLRNLSWRADTTSKEILREVGSVNGLMKSSMLIDNKENTLKSILSALWNLSAHCTENKSEICSIDGSLNFLVNMLTYKSPTKSLAIIENSGGILRNISSQIAVRDDYREILRKNNCLKILLEQLKSPSLTIVSNSCGTLWNLSAKCKIDQELLWEMGAPAMLRSLNHSKHKMIAMGSSAALKNLLQSRPPKHTLIQPIDSVALEMDLPILPTLDARKQKALLNDLDHTLTETFDNIESDNNSTNIFNKTNHNETKSFNYNKNDNKKFIKQTHTSTTSSGINCSNNDNDDDDDCNNFYSLNEPSTSYAIKNDNSNSLPYLNDNLDNGKSNKQLKKLKMPKNFNKAKNIESSSISNDQIDLIDSNYFNKSKEINAIVDEKDHCSIEDVSESDIQQQSTNLLDELINDNELNQNDEIVNFIECPSTLTNFEKFNKHYCNESNEFVVMGSSNSDLQDIETSQIKQNPTAISSKLPIFNTRIQNKSNNSGIPLPKSKIDLNDENDLTKINKTSKNTRQLLSGLPRRSLPTNKLNTTNNCNLRRERSSESIKVENNDLSSEDNVSLLSDYVTENINNEKTINIENKNLETDNQKTGVEIKEEEKDQVKEEDSKIVEIELLDDNMDNTTSPDLCTDNYDNRLARSCDETNRMVDNRMLDPDAMIESLDRFTAELVSQASHLQTNKDDNNENIKYKLNDNNNTWNDDTSPSNEVTFPSISCSPPNVITFEDEYDEFNEKKNLIEDIIDIGDCNEQQSNDFSSITMTESTLIAMEATKLVTVLKNEIEITQNSLELDEIQPPSTMNSLNNSLIMMKSPKLIKRKLNCNNNNSSMIRKVLNNSLNNGSSSVESLENHSLISNLDQMNPPSTLGDVLDMEGSITSIASLPNDLLQIKTDFIQNGLINNKTNSIIDLENINPPSIFNEITDMCNSLADIQTFDGISETENYQDCFTHLTINNTIHQQTTTEDDLTEFSDANSNTPVLSDSISSPEITPQKKLKNLTKQQMTTKQKRNFARDRYKTYTIAAEMVMKEEEEKISNRTNDQVLLDQTFTKNISTQPQPLNINQEIATSSSTQVEQQQQQQSSPNRNKSIIKKQFIQKRLENKDRFKTQVLTESSFKPPSESSTITNLESVVDVDDLHLLVEKEANLVIKSLRETKTTRTMSEELLDCETLSLVSNDDDSEHNSCSSINYRTYHKSWGVRKNNIPVIDDDQLINNSLSDNNLSNDQIKNKPKIVKPSNFSRNSTLVLDDKEREEEEGKGKGIRGRRKPLYSKTINTNNTKLKPIKNVTSNLVKNVTSVIKSSTNLKPMLNKPVINKPSPVTNKVVTSSGYGVINNKSKRNIVVKNTNTVGNKSAIKTVPNHTNTVVKVSPQLERQGTFTKDDNAVVVASGKSKIPMTTTKIPSSTFTNRLAATKTTTTSIPSTSRIPSVNKTTNKVRNGFIKSASSDRSNSTNNNIKVYNRSTSADSRDSRSLNHIKSSLSTQSLKSDNSRNGTIIKKNTILPNTTTNQRSNNNNNTTKKQVTSKIASLWKKIEDSKNKQVVKNDNRVWIQSDNTGNDDQIYCEGVGGSSSGSSNSSNTGGVSGINEVVMRNRNTQKENDSTTKRISRLGSFIIMDENEGDGRLQEGISGCSNTK